MYSSELYITGVKFWKTPSRKLFAVDRGVLRGKLQLQSQNIDNGEEQSSPSITSAEGVTVMNEIAHLRDDIKSLHVALWAKNGNMPMSLKNTIGYAFKCKICQDVPFKPPIIVAKCCSNVVGCQSCVDQWYSGESD